MMKKIARYDIIEVIHETQTSIIARGKKKNDDKTVIVKLLKSDNTSEADIARLRQEYEIIQNIQSTGVINTHEIVKHDTSLALILEDFNGSPLHKKIEMIQVDLTLFFTIAINITKTLGEIHQSNIIHKDINPSNILISSDNSIVKITDFGISSMLQKNDTDSSTIFEGTLKYISPEQTGRMNRLIDYRTDYYSLGVTFYEMLTGKVPFLYKDPMELIHAHIARIPQPPVELSPDIPQVLSDIVMRLMAKTGEDRYQSAYSINKDLGTCLTRYTQTGEVEPFEIAENDIPHIYVQPQIIVGRDNEIARLKNCFEDVCLGSTEMILVEGPSGIGKSTLINELYKPVSEARGFFISGKYNQYRRNVPYSALIQAFQQLINQILAESPEKIDEWKDKFLKAVGVNGQVLIDSLPDFEKLIGKQSPVPSIEPEKEQNRYKYVFKNVFKIISSKEAPLTFFLDDLQWVDLPSLHFIEMIIRDKDIESLLLICAYRDNEVDKGHPFIMLSEKLSKLNVPIETLSLPFLKVEDINKLIVTALHCDEKRSFALAEIVHSKTNGNPFFVNQYLLDLYDKKYIHFKPASGWEWSTAEIKNLQITDNVVDLMSSKISQLPDATINMLKLCACIGNRFDLVTLALIAEKTVDKALSDLMGAVHNGLIVYKKGKYRFVHDKIHEAAYLLTNENEKKELHLLTARMALNSTDSESYRKKLLYIVDHYNKGLDLIKETEELEHIAQINLEAGEKARKAIAYKSAETYFETGITILKKISSNYWSQYYKLSLNLYSNAAQTMMFLIEYDKMNEYAESVIQNAVTVFDKVPVYETLIINAVTLNDPEKALQIGLSVSRQMNVNFPRRFLKFHVAVNLVFTILKLKCTKANDFLSFAEVNDETIKTQMRFMTHYATAAYRSKSEYVPLITLKGLLYTKNKGISPSSPFAMAGYGLLLCLTGNYKKGIEFGQQAIKVIEKFNYPEQATKVYMSLAAFIMHWQDSPQETEELLTKAYNSGLEYGDHVYASLCLTFSAYHNYYTSLELDEYETLLQKYSEILSGLGQKSNLRSVRIYLQACVNLKSSRESFEFLDGAFYDEKTALPLIIESNNKPHLFSNFFLGSILSYLAGNYERAQIYVNRAKEELPGALGSYAHALLYFYDPLIQLAVYKNSGWLQKQKTNLKIHRILFKLKKLAKASPVNHLNKYYLIKAELAKINGQKIQAVDYYYKAIETAEENGFTQEKGMAHELAADYYLGVGHEETGGYHLKKARQSFQKWGATAKVKQLEKKYPDYLTPKDETILPAFNRMISGNSTVSDTTSLDFSSIMKSSQAFSSITDLKLLLEKVLVISMENAGAQKGALLLENNGELFVEAEGGIDNDYSVLNSIPLNNSTSVCIPIVKDVLKTKKSLVLDDASNGGNYIKDKYIIKNKPKSILTIPVIHQSKFTGILYLENNLATRTFTPDRVAILKILSTQAAISIKIARQSNQLSIANRELLEAKTIAENANRAKTGFLTNMAHEFRTPLNGIEGELQILKDIALEHSISHSFEHIDNIAASSKRLMTSINEVIDFSDLESGTLVPDISTFDISERIAGISDIIKNEIQSKNLLFNLKVHPEIPDLIKGDEKRIIRIILSLLENSIKFTSKGSISLDVSYSDTSKLDIIVEDTGQGISEKKLERIFSAFGEYDQGQTFTKHFEGLGLGLSVTAKIIQLMQGTINVKSTEGKGTTFSISIPAKKVGNQKSSQVDLSKYNALIVEDNKVNAKVLNSFLKKLGLTVEIAVDGKLGVKQYQTGNFNIIFMDVQMPVMNGLEATKAIRAGEACQNKRIPIIGVTANAKKHECIEAGMDAFIQKPVTKIAILETILGVLSNTSND